MEKLIQQMERDLEMVREIQERIGDYYGVSSDLDESKYNWAFNDFFNCYWEEISALESGLESFARNLKELEK